MSVQPSTRRFPVRPVSSLAGLAAVRESFVEWLAGTTAAAERIEDLSVVVSELGANAVRSSPEGADAPTVAAWVEDDLIVLEVANRVDDGAVPDVAWDLADPLRTGGRGLLLVSAFVDDVHVEVAGDVLVIRCSTRA